MMVSRFWTIVLTSSDVWQEIFWWYTRGGSDSTVWEQTIQKVRMFAIHQLLSPWSCLVGKFIGTQGSIRCEHIKYISHVVCCVWLIEYIRSHGSHLVGQYIWIRNVRGPVLSSELVPFRYMCVSITNWNHFATSASIYRYMFKWKSIPARLSWIMGVHCTLHTVWINELTREPVLFPSRSFKDFYLARHLNLRKQNHVSQHQFVSHSFTIITFHCLDKTKPVMWMNQTEAEKLRVTMFYLWKYTFVG